MEKNYNAHARHIPYRKAYTKHPSDSSFDTHTIFVELHMTSNSVTLLKSKLTALLLTPLAISELGVGGVRAEALFSFFPPPRHLSPEPGRV